jgi:UPF0176 protein
MSIHSKTCSDTTPIVVAALYKFVSLEDFEGLRERLLEVTVEADTRGTLLLALEGINGTIAGSREAVDKVLSFLRSDPRLVDLDHKESYTDENPFYRMKVKLKKEIVTIGDQAVDPNKAVGTYVEPEDWNDILNNPDVIVLDTRNDYEVSIGTFEGAVNPHTTSFREFPQYVKENIDPKKQKKVAMFCTGGIRCEKASSYMLTEGFDEVYHLKGGILKYLEKVPVEEQQWEGECFVFDNRVAVDNNLNVGQYDMCHACRMPITEEEKRGEHYEQGVACHHCHDKVSDEQRAAFRERERQIQLSKARGEQHIGVTHDPD